MGWWRIEGPSGRINWENIGRDKWAILHNCMPALETNENYYNGDEPTDILDKVVNPIIGLLTADEYRTAAKNAFLGLEVAETDIDLVHKQSLQRAQQKIRDVYMREWGRHPYAEELEGIFEFCTAFVQQNAK